MGGDYTSDVGHTAVTELQGIPIKDLAELVLFGEAYIYQL